MQGARQHILLEFFEKLFATLALASGSVLAPVALFPLLGRRVAWRRVTPKGEIAQTLAYREIVLLLAMALGAVVGLPLHLVPLDPLILAAFFLILGFGMMLLAERSTAALFPRFSPIEWTGKGLRNLAGWALLGLVLTTFLRAMDPRTLMAACLVSITFAFVPVAMAYQRGEPGLLIPGSLITLLGVGLWNPWIAAAGFGWLLPSAILITHNLKASFAFRSLACWLAALAGLWAPSWMAIVAMALLFVLTLESWRFLLRLAIYFPLRTLHRFKIYGSENYGADGPAILLSNHVTMIDGWLLGAVTQRMVRFLAFDAYFKNPIARFGLNLFRSIPISQGAKREAIESLRQARKVIEEGHFAGIFPEGGITRAGHLQPFQKGFTRIVSGTQIPIIPAYMNGLWTNLLSFGEQKVHLKIGRFFRNLEIEYGAPLPPTVTARQLWDAVKSLEVKAAFRDAHNAPILPVAFLTAAGQYGKQIAVVDHGKPLTYDALAGNALLFARHINRRLRRKARIGIFLPDGTEKVIAHVAVLLSGHVVMEVPALHGAELEAFINTHGLGTLVTSQAWIEQHDLAKSDAMLFIGRALERFDTRDQTRIWLYRKLSPRLAWKQVCTHSMRKDSAAAIVSSPNQPVVLSHRGLWSAAHAARRVLWFRPGVTVNNQLPLDRPVSLSIGFWMPLLNGATLVIGPAPADFELRDQSDFAQAHEASKYVLVVNPESDLGDRYLPILELAEASGAIAISSPPVDFMNEVQTCVKPGAFGRLPFGLEMRETETGVQIRTPARLLRYLDVSETRTQARLEEWLDVDVPLTLNDLCFVELRPTLALQTSSTPTPGQTTSHPPGE